MSADHISRYLYPLARDIVVPGGFVIGGLIEATEGKPEKLLPSVAVAAILFGLFRLVDHAQEEFLRMHEHIDKTTVHTINTLWMVATAIAVYSIILR